MKSALTTLALLTTVASAGPAPQQAYIIEGSAYFGAPGIELASIGVFDLANPGAVTVVSQAAPDLRFGGADIRPGTADLIGFENTTNSLRVLDLINDGNTLIDSIGFMDSGVAGMAYSNDGSIVYVTTTVGAFVRIMEVDAATGAPISIHNIITDSISSLAVVPQGHPTLSPGSLYGLALTAFGSVRLVEIDLESNSIASSTSVFGIGFNPQFETGLDFAPDGTLYAIIQGYDEVAPDVFVEISSHLYSINPSTGSATDIGVIEADGTWDGVTLVVDTAATAGCPADFTGDGTLDIFDVFAFLDAFNAMNPAADFTGDGSFDIFDVFAFLDAFNAGCP